jgi:hypothetical protein
MSNTVTQHIPDFARTAQSAPFPVMTPQGHLQPSTYPQASQPALGALSSPATYPRPFDAAPSPAPPPAGFGPQPVVYFTPAPAPAPHPPPPFVHEKSHSLLGFGSTEPASGELLIQGKPTTTRRPERGCPSPRDWSKKRKIIVSVVIFLILGGIIGGAVGATQAKKTHVCTCPSWTDSFGQGHPGAQYECYSDGSFVEQGPLAYCAYSTF